MRDVVDIRRKRRLERVLLVSLVVLPSILHGSAALHALVPAAHADEDDEEAANRLQAPSRVRIVNGETELVLSPAAVRNAGIATARPGAVPAAGSMQAYGEVLSPATLTDLASRYRSAAAQVEAARARASASRAALTRAQSLYRDRQNMSAAQLQSAQSAQESDEASLDAAQSSRAALAATVTQSWGPVLAGAITQDSALLRDLIARRNYLLAVTLPPGIVPAGSPPVASARLPSGTSIALKFISPGTTADAQVQGLRYYYEAAATRGLLAGLNLPVTLETPGGVRGELVVPESAVVWLAGKPWVYRLISTAASDAPGRPANPSVRGAAVFVRESISPERQTTEGGYVVPGLPADTLIVVRGAQLLLSEEFRAQVEAQDND